MCFPLRRAQSLEPLGHDPGAEWLVDLRCAATVARLSATIVAKPNLDFPALRDASYPVHRIAAQLDPYLRVIVERFRPERIILFGSQVRSEPGEDSDVDLLVVRRGIVSERGSNLEIRSAFDEIPGVPPAFTLLSKTPERIAERLAARSPFYEDMVLGGLTLYPA